MAVNPPAPEGHIATTSVTVQWHWLVLCRSVALAAIVNESQKKCATRCTTLCYCSTTYLLTQPLCLLHFVTLSLDYSALSLCHSTFQQQLCYSLCGGVSSPPKDWKISRNSLSITKIFQIGNSISTWKWEQLLFTQPHTLYTASLSSLWNLKLPK